MASEGWQGCRTNYFFVNEQSLQASSYASATREIKTLRIRRIAGGGGATSKEGCGSGSFKVVEVNLPGHEAPHDITGEEACSAIGADNGHPGDVGEAVGCTWRV